MNSQVSEQRFRRTWRNARWCSKQRLQAVADQITTAKLLAYVRDQINRWTDGEDPDAPEDPEYRMYRPETLTQGMNALVYYGERSAPEAPDNREAREAIRLFRKEYNATHAPAWRVTGRKSPRRRRDQPVTRPAGHAAGDSAVGAGRTVRRPVRLTRQRRWIQSSA